MTVVGRDVVGSVAALMKSAMGCPRSIKWGGMILTVLLIGLAPNTSLRTTAMRPMAVSSANSPRYRQSTVSASGVPPSIQCR